MQVDCRLIEQLQRVGGQCPAQPGGNMQPLLQIDAHGGLIEAVRFAVVLGAIHGDVRPLEQVLRIVAVAGKQDDTDAGAYIEGKIPDLQRLQQACVQAFRYRRRSEGHTSELQSLMRISYAVFCLNKKKNNSNIKDT